MRPRVLEPIVRARRQLAWIAALHGVQLAFGLAVAWPFAAVVRSAYASHPLGDRVLFADGALELVDFVGRELPPQVPALSAHVVVIFVLAALARLVMFGATIAMLAFRVEGRWEERAGAAIRAGAARFGALAFQSISTAIAQGIVIALAVAALTGVSNALTHRMGAPNAGRVGIAVGLVLVGLALLLGVQRDIAAARVVAYDEPALRSIAQAFRVVTRRPIFWVEYAWRSATGALFVVAAAAVASQLGGRPGGALVFLFVVHQVALAMRIALRVSWLASILRRLRPPARDAAFVTVST